MYYNIGIPPGSYIMYNLNTILKVYRVFKKYGSKTHVFYHLYNIITFDTFLTPVAYNICICMIYSYIQILFKYLFTTTDTQIFYIHTYTNLDKDKYCSRYMPVK